MTDKGKGEVVLPVFAGSTVAVGDWCYYHDDSGVRYARPVGDALIGAIATVTAAFIGVAASAGVGDDGDEVTIRFDTSVKSALADASALAGNRVGFDDDTTNLLSQGVKINGTNYIGCAGNNSSGPDVWVHVRTQVFLNTFEEDT